MSNTTPTVWVIQESPNISYADAERYGDIDFIANRDYRAERGDSPMNNDLIAHCENIMSRNYCPERGDSLLLGGDPVLIGYVTHLAFKANKTVRLLKWDRVAARYYLVTLNDK